MLAIKELLYPLQTDRPSDENTGDDANQWRSDDQKIYHLLVIYTDEGAGATVQQYEGSQSGKLAWNALIMKYEPRGIVGTVSLHQELMSLKMGEGEDPDAFFIRIETIRRKLATLGTELSDEVIQGMMLAKLPANYSVCVAIMETQSQLDYAGMKEQIRAFYKRHIIGEASGEDAGFALICFGCGLPGHTKPDCPKKQDQQPTRRKGYAPNNFKGRGGYRPKPSRGVEGNRHQKGQIKQPFKGRKM